MSLPLHYHFHLGQPSLDELHQGKASLRQLCLQYASNEVIWSVHQHSIQIGDQVLEENVAVWQGYDGAGLDQVHAALDYQ